MNDKLIISLFYFAVYEMVLLYNNNLSYQMILDWTVFIRGANNE